MKTIPLLFLLGAFGCTQKFQVHTTADADYDVRLFSTYNWQAMVDIESGKNPLYYNEMNDKYIREAVDKNLLANNFKRVVEPAEMIIHYHIIERGVSITREDPYFYHHAPWMRSERVYEDYSEGTLIIDIMERKSNALVWRGLAAGIFSSAQPYLSKKEIDAAINAIFEEFPRAFF